MKIHPLLLSLMSILLFFAACQKEKSFETGSNPSAGSLQSDIADDCLPKTVAGVYEEGTVLDPATNYIDVQVVVTKAGSYLIYTDTLNGTYFRANGAFATAGANTVRLIGNGTPANDGIYNFTVTYTASECIVPVTVLPTGGAVDAVLTLDGAPDQCMNYVFAGDYIAGVDMTIANTVVINVNVTTAGIYNISTQLSNGMTFAGAGTLATGAQTITLTASGIPIAVSSTNFPVTVGSSTCNFAVIVTATPSTVDYFPRTAGSNWSYQYDDTPDDSLLVRATSNTVTHNGSNFTVFEGTDDASLGFFDYGDFRKNGSDYYSYIELVDDDTTKTIPLEYIFLKDNVPATTSWQSQAVNVTLNGIPLSLRINLTLEQKDITVRVNGSDYDSTMVVAERYEVLVPGTTTWIDLTDQGGYFKSYYAKGVGLIKADAYFEAGNPNPTTLDSKMEIRRYQIVP
jgi:hypothetical protein